HNFGFKVVDQLMQISKIKNQGDRLKLKMNKKFKAEICELRFGDERQIIAKPQTMMNASGLSVASISKYLNIPISNIWVVHDDLDLPLGTIQIKKGGGTAGHKGLESIVKEVGNDDFIRFRLGIGRPSNNEKSKTNDEQLIEKYVLSPFSVTEKDQASQVIKVAIGAIHLAIKLGLEKAMNEYN
ncbi:aminoacyl-tRNA hydrolase, partial [Patescibacteria group bacterium]